MKKALSLFLCLLLVLTFSVTAFADMGPKPSVHITFKNAPDEPYFVTLLSKADHYGPWSAEQDWNYDYITEPEKSASDYLSHYEDPDGYYFIGNVAECTETGSYSWTYYPPDPFKILVYYPESGTVVTGEIQSRYAFDSYYEIDLSEPDFTPKTNYDYLPEILSLIIRVVLTLAVELLIALLFGFKKKKLFLFVTIVNIVTQLLLNLVLNFIEFKAGFLAFVLVYVLLEILVAVFECLLYLLFFKKISPNPPKKFVTVLYALLANGASFLVGIWLSAWLTSVF